MRRGSGGGSRVAADVPYTIEELLRAATVPFRGGPLTVAGRALQKHAPSNRPSSPYPEPVGSPAQINHIAYDVIAHILRHPATQVYIYRGRYIHAAPATPDRRLVRWNLDGSFGTPLEQP